MAYSAKQIAELMWIADWQPGTVYVTESGIAAGQDKKLQQFKEWLDVAIAICLAESGGNPGAANSSSTARGLWQVMVSAHKDKLESAWEEVYTDDGMDLQNLKNADGSLNHMRAALHPVINTIVARKIYTERGNTWGAWEVYNKGTYKQYLGHGNEAFKAMYGNKAMKGNKAKLLEEYALGQETASMAAAVLPGAGAATAALESDMVGRVLTFVKSAGSVAGLFLFGLVALILGVWFIAGMQTPHTAAAKQLGKALKT